MRRLDVVPDAVFASPLTASVSPGPPSAPVNLRVRHFNESALTLSWDPPQDRGGRPEVSYRLQCEREEEEEAGGRWGPCPEETLVLSDPAGPSGTSASLSGLSPHSSYRLSVQAWNSISALQGVPPPPTATITIHKCRRSSSPVIKNDPASAQCSERGVKG